MGPAAVLGAYARALRGEAHVLAIRPDAVWQQLYNRLEWEAAPVRDVLTGYFDRNDAGHRRPWLRSRRPLPRPAGLTLSGHSGGVTAIRFSPTGERLYTTAEDGALRVWAVASGEAAGDLIRFEAALLCGTLSAEGVYLAVGDIDGRVRVLNAETGEQIWSLSVSDRPVRTCSFSTIGGVLGIGADDGTLMIRTADAGHPLERLAGHDGAVLSCAFHPTGRVIASVGADGVAGVQIIRTGGGFRRRVATGLPLYCCAFSPAGTSLAVGGEAGHVQVLDAESGSKLWESDAGAPVLSCDFSPTGQLFAAGNHAGELRIWQLPGVQPVSVLPAHTAWINSCQFSPDESWIATAAGDETAKIWRLAHDRGRAQSLASFNEPSTAGTTPARETSKTGTASTWHEMPAISGGILGCAFSTENDFLATVGNDGRVRIWDASSGQLLAVLSGHDGPATGCAFMQDGRLVTAGSDGAVRIWNLETESATLLGKHYAPVHDCAVSGDGRWVASAGGDTVRLWDTDTGALVSVFRGHRGTVYGCDFHPRLPLVASAGADHTVRLWDLRNASPFKVLRLHRHHCLHCVFSTSGDQMATAAFDHLVLVWETATWRPICAIKSHTAPVRSCAFGPDDSQLLSAGWDKALRVTDLSSGSEQAALFGDANFMCCCWSRKDGTIAAGDEWTGTPYVLELADSRTRPGSRSDT